MTHISFLCILSLNSPLEMVFSTPSFSRSCFTDSLTSAAISLNSSVLIQSKGDVLSPSPLALCDVLLVLSSVVSLLSSFAFSLHLLDKFILASLSLSVSSAVLLVRLTPLFFCLGSSFLEMSFLCFVSCVTFLGFWSDVLAFPHPRPLPLPRPLPFGCTSGSSSSITMTSESSLKNTIKVLSTGKSYHFQCIHTHT